MPRKNQALMVMLALGSVLSLAVAGVAAGEQDGKKAKPMVIPAQQHAGNNAQAIAISADGKLVAGAFGGPATDSFPLKPRGGSVRIWKADSGELVHAVPEYGDIIRLEFSEDCKSLVYGRIFTPGDSVHDSKTAVIDVETGKVRRRWETALFALGRSADEIVIVNNRLARLSLKDFKPLERIRHDSTQALAFSPDGAWMAAAEAAHLSLLKSATDIKRIETSNARTAQAIAVSLDGKHLVTGHPDGVVRIWDVTKQAEAHKLAFGGRGHAYPFFSPDGKTLAVATQPANGARWSYDKRQPGGFKTDQERADAVCLLVFLDASTFKEVGRWQFEDGAYKTWYARHTAAPSGPESNPARFAYSRDGKAIVAGCNGALLMDAASGKVIKQFDSK